MVHHWVLARDDVLRHLGLVLAHHCEAKAPGLQTGHLLAPLLQQPGHTGKAGHCDPYPMSLVFVQNIEQFEGGCWVKVIFSEMVYF